MPQMQREVMLPNGERSFSRGRCGVRVTVLSYAHSKPLSHSHTFTC